MTDSPNVRLELANLPENVALVREMLAGIAEAVPLGHGMLDDIKTVVSEAANNVVLHAYNGDAGPLVVEVEIGDGQIVIVVRDMGCGIDPQPAAEAQASGIGLSLIEALTDRAVFSGASGAGTEVRMEFTAPAARCPPDGARMGTAARRADHDGAATATLMITPVSLARTVLSRPICALAARASFSIDRLSDVQLVADALTADAERAITGSALELDVAVEPNRLELRFGPFAAGAAAQLVGASAVGGLESLVEMLADEVVVSPGADGELLIVRLLDRR